MPREGGGADVRAEEPKRQSAAAGGASAIGRGAGEKGRQPIREEEPRKQSAAGGRGRGKPRCQGNLEA